MDGYSAFFSKYICDAIGAKVCNIVMELLNSSTSLTSINKTYITLIPKLKKPTKMIDFSPISLCNVIYKIIFNILDNKIKLILPQNVSTHQSAFISGCLIYDDMLTT